MSWYVLFREKCKGSNGLFIEKLIDLQEFVKTDEINKLSVSQTILISY